MDLCFKRAMEAYFESTARACIILSAALCGQFALCSISEGAVGRTAGKFDVSGTGAANYSVPIRTPPGARGIEPKLALVYNSRGGNGLLGPGWSINGLSNISRCARTWVQDGAPGPVTITAADKFCLDGNRLRLASGTYGSASSTYRTELETFSRITAVSVAGNGPAYFTVERKDGLIYDYGNSTDSRVIAGSSTTPYEWKLRRIRDRSGNYLTITYTQANGTARPSTIAYTVTPTISTQANYRVLFDYTTRAAGDNLNGYVAGNPKSVTSQLSTISIQHWAGTAYATTRRYDLTYEVSPTTASKRLTQIQECVGTDCFSPTTVSYQNGASGVANPTLQTGGLNDGARSVDVNGDGRDDLLYAVSGSGPSPPRTWHVRLATASGFGAAISTGAVTPCCGQDWLLTDDFLSKGNISLLAPSAGVPEGSTWYLYNWNGSAFVASPTGLPIDPNRLIPSFGAGPSFVSADINGDGRPDLVWAANINGVRGVYTRLNTSNGSTLSFSSTATLGYPVSAACCGGTGFAFPFWGLHGNNTHRGFGGFGSAVRRLDFNNDGRDDVIYNTHDSSQSLPYQWITLLSQGTTFAVGENLFSSANNGVITNWNNDACTDLIYGTKISISACNGISGAVFSSGLFETQIGYALDWDNDGRMDLVSANVNTWYRSLGDSVAAPAPTGVTSTQYSCFVFDQNGDGLHDLGCYSPSLNAIVYGLHNGAGTPADLMSSVSDGFGISASPAYASITQSNYTKDTGAAAAAFPEKDIATPIYVVKQLVASNGIGGTFTQSFHYYGAKTHVQGRGFEGFRRKRMQDSRNSLWLYEDFKQQFPFAGALDKSELYQPNNATLISSKDNTWATLSYTSLDGGRLFPYTGQLTASRYEVGGVYNGNLISTTTATNLANAAGGMIYDSTTTTVEATTANGAQPGATYTRHIYNPVANLVNDTANWCLGRPGKTLFINSHSATGGASITRTTDRSWDPIKCRVTQEVDEPGNAQLQVTTDYDYDDEAGQTDPDVGNLTRVAVTGIGMIPRVMQTSYGTTGQFPISVTNALNQATQLGWDYALGVQTSRNDPNGLAVNWQYDAFGRRTREDRPDGTATTWVYNACASIGSGCTNGNNVMAIQAFQRDTADAIVRLDYVYTDRFDRVLSTRTELLSGAYNRVDRVYDSLGRIDKETVPCWWSSCTQYWIDYSYDILNRPFAVFRPVSDSDPTTQSTLTYFEGLTTRTVDAEGKQSTKIANAVGGVARSVNHNGYYQSFDYDAFDDVLSVTDSASNTLQSNTYNVRGMKTAQTDMDMGAWTYLPNALGEVTNIRDAKTTSPNWTTILSYDTLGRLTSRQDVAEGVTSTWTWGASAANHNIGQLASLSGGGYSESYTYDNLGRPQQTSITSDATYQFNYTYNTIGKLDTLTYPASTSGYRLKLQYGYQNGQLAQITDFNIPADVFWTANASDARGSIIDETLFNGIQTIRGFDQVTGLVDYIQSGPSATTTVQNLSYQWDKVGNLKQRQDVRQGLTETFTYDNLHRLDITQLNGVTTLDMAYDALGNITSKSDVGAYTYHPTKKHAVLSAGSNTFTYDANGNQITRNGQTVSWYSYNLPNTINGGTGYSSQFFYGPQRNRWKQLASYGGTPETTLYVGGLLEKVTLNGVTSWKHYVNGTTGPIAVYLRKTNGTNPIRYLTKDHLGSVDSMSLANGTLDVRLSFNPLGLRRKEAGWSGNPTSTNWSKITATTRHGYTFHEGLDNLSLVHMNGRVYDPAIGRFISADPIVSNPMDTQSYNRYSYVHNNPLSFTDPSGFEEEVLDEVVVEGHRDDGGGDSNWDDFWKWPDWTNEYDYWYWNYWNYWNSSTPSAPASAPIMEQTPPPLRHDNELKQKNRPEEEVQNVPQEEPLGDTVGYLLKGLVDKWDAGCGDAANCTEVPIFPLGRLGPAARAAESAIEEGTSLFRVFGGEAKGLGQSWTTVNPGTVTNFREAAGLFPGNTGQFVIEGRLMNTEGVLFREALPGPGGIGGGLSEVLVPNASQQICTACVSGANPPF